jgi:hypothetical protein
VTTIDRFKALLGEATPGPWINRGGRIHTSYPLAIDDDFIASACDQDARLICLLREIAEPLAEWYGAHDKMGNCVNPATAHVLKNTLARAIERHLPEEK